METKKRLHLSKTQSFCLFLYRYSFHFKTRNPRIFHSFHDDFFFQFYPLIRIINLSQFTLVTIISFFFHYIFCLISKTYCHLPKRRRTSTGNLISTKHNMKTMNSHHIVFHFIKPALFIVYIILRHESFCTLVPLHKFSHSVQ